MENTSDLIVFLIVLSVVALVIVLVLLCVVPALRKPKLGVNSFLGIILATDNSLSVPNPIPDTADGGVWSFPTTRFKRRTETVLPLVKSSGLLPSELYNGVYNVGRSVDSIDTCRASCLNDAYCTAFEFDSANSTCVKSVYNPRVFLRTWGKNICNPLGPLVCEASASTVEFIFRPTISLTLPPNGTNCETVCSTDSLLPHTSDWLGQDTYYFSTLCMGTVFNGVNYVSACDLAAPPATASSCICTMDPSTHRTILSADVLGQQTAVNPTTLINDLLMSTTQTAS
jgi:hypothetical protein